MISKLFLPLHFKEGLDEGATGGSGCWWGMLGGGVGKSSSEMRDTQECWREGSRVVGSCSGREMGGGVDRLMQPGEW